ncbi:hypothetical protein FGW37_15595 [Streptomyces rectiverticillatus]|uniref:hypothetical protein n=1 Tax=Streptomyces rectiverticillatus TaxID=173860 RepID=UPI0015C33629|nr:hypothetical protein [Streptomyces rectiverticillatus]QLE72821.1 hypothetical protein FGW37_15595 [Streptomyces rectiverticillatus]
MARTEFTEAVVARAAPTAAPPETAVIRLVGALPAGWDCSWRLQEDGILLKVQPAAGAGPGAVAQWLAGVLDAGGLRGWRAVR